MGLIQNFIQNRKESNRKVKEYEDNDNMVSNVERKKMSHNEREVLAILKKEKENSLKEILRLEEKRRKGHELLLEREMMSGRIHLLE